MRIALVITGLGVGGAERLVVQLAERYVQMGHDVLLLYLGGVAEVLPEDRRVSVVGLGMEASVGSRLRGLFSLRKHLLEFAPDVVNSHLVHANLATRLLRLTMRMPRLVCSAHTPNEEGRFRMLAYRWTDWLADMSTNVSFEAKQAFVEQRAVSPEKMTVVHNAIDVEKFSFSPGARVRLREELRVGDGKMILAVGRLVEAKDYPTLLAAYRTFLGQHPGNKLFIVGEGHLRQQVERLVEENGLSEDVVLLGKRLDVEALLSACDVFVLSSAWEGFGLVVAEAMACERPVVSTDCGGVREVMGELGYLSPPRNAELLAQHLSEAAGLDELEASKLGRSARERIVTLFSMDAALARWMTIYSGGKSEQG